MRATHRAETKCQLKTENEVRGIAGAVGDRLVE